MKTSDVLIQSEQAVIGCLIVDNNCFDEARLSVNDFFNHSHKIIFSAIKSFLDDGKTLDLIILFEYLDKQGELEKVGGMAYIAAMVEGVMTTKNFKYHAQNIQEKSKLRLLKSFLADMESFVNDKQGIDEITEKAESGLFNLLESKEESNMCHISKAVAEAIDWEDSEHVGVKTGLRDLDWMINGFHKSNLIIIAGRPSMGKSALAMQIADHVSKTEQVIIFSLEMPKREVANRFVRFHERSVGKSQAVAHLNGLKLHIDDSAAITISHIRSECRKVKRKHGLSMIVVDYLQLMQGAGENRTQEIGMISRSLKAIAKEFDIPVVALSQLSRRVDERADKRPVMSDLRDSGEIEQDADVILFVYRDEEYDRMSDYRGLAEIICRKNRNGAKGDVTATFNGEVTRFGDHNGERILRSVPKPREKGFSI
jgi:replicative DNA helicase